MAPIRCVVAVKRWWTSPVNLNHISNSVRQWSSMNTSLPAVPVRNSALHVQKCVSSYSRSPSRYFTRYIGTRSAYKPPKYYKNHVVPSFLRAEQFLNYTALFDQNGRHIYRDILSNSSNISLKLLEICENEKGDINEARIAMLCPNDVSYLASVWGIWMSGGIAVPLHKSHPPSEHKYFLEDSKCSVVITTEEFADNIRPLAQKLKIHHIVLKKDEYVSENASTENVARLKNRFDDLVFTNQFKNRRALIIYTSGTTGRPKGVVHTHGTLDSQISGMVEAWDWSPSDVILHTLPLHHVHGVVNVLLTPMHVGATCVMLPNFEPKKTWSMLVDPIGPEMPRINLFMAVPTIYAKLIQDHKERFLQGSRYKQRREYVRNVCTSRIRLMVSGSAALPEPIMNEWEDITGHRLLERYGMTETGMALTNPLHGPRVPGAVGHPFPGVEVCIAKNNVYAKHGYDMLVHGTHRETSVLSGMNDDQGDLYVRGNNVFKEYWNKPEATKSEFTTDGWFKTGDTACYKDGAFCIMGRTSVDIIKSGGYKISALDIERHLLSHQDISEVAVVGLPDFTWGQKVAAVVTTSTTSSITLESLRQWCEGKMPPYHIPTVLRVVDTIPRNAMGKINKKELVKNVFQKIHGA